MNVVLIGAGGIGSHLAGWTARFLAWRPGQHELLIVDKDTFEDKNRERQSFRSHGNKARVIAEELRPQFRRVRIDYLSEYVTPENVSLVLSEDAIVLIAVDNHATRKVVSDAARDYRNITIISGGNEETHGTVQVYARRNGRDVTPPLTQDHPEIERPDAPAPYEMHCEERARAGEPQIFAANLMAGVVMFAVLWRLTERPDGFISFLRGSHETAYTEIHFEVFDLLMRAECRPVSSATKRKEKRNGKKEAGKRKAKVAASHAAQ